MVSIKEGERSKVVNFIEILEHALYVGLFEWADFSGLFRFFLDWNFLHYFIFEVLKSENEKDQKKLITHRIWIVNINLLWSWRCLEKRDFCQWERKAEASCLYRKGFGLEKLLFYMHRYLVCLAGANVRKWIGVWHVLGRDKFFIHDRHFGGHLSSTWSLFFYPVEM